MDYYKISKAVVVPFPSPGGQFNKNTFWYDLENHYLMETGRFSKERLIPFLGVNPNDKECVKNIKILFPFFEIKGIKLSHQIPMNFSIDKLINHSLMKIVQDNNIIFMMHIGTGKEQGAQYVHATLNYAIKVAKYYPNIQFIFCHLGRLHWSLIEALNLENVHMDTAGLSLWEKWEQFIAAEPLSIFKSSTPVEVIEKLIEMGYEDKIVFGSDEPYTHYKTEIGNIGKAEMPNGAKRKIFYENIQRLLKFKR